MLYAVIVILTIVLVRLIIHLSQKDKEKDNRTTVVMSKVYVWIFIIGSILFALGALAYQLFSGEDIILTVVLAIAAILSFLCSLCCSSFRINMKDQEFTYRTSFGRTYTFSYTDVTELTATENAVHMVAGKKNFWIDSKALGVEKFIRAVENKELTM